MIQSTHPYPTCILIHLLMDAMRGVEMGKKNASGPDTLNAPLWIRLRDAYRNAPIVVSMRWLKALPVRANARRSRSIN
jgi:hypothetical protein